MSKNWGVNMKKQTLLLVVIFFICFQFLSAENFTIYTGSTSKKIAFLGSTIGGDIWHFIQLQLDVFKYLQQDQSLYSAKPENNRGDFLGASINFALKFPIHLIPYLEKLDYIQPYIVAGYGYGIENLASEYINLPDKDGKTGFFSKLRQFDSFGYGIIIMITPSFGFKIDSRSIKISKDDGMGYPYRRFTRFSFGICFGKYK